jgi:Ca-activated chloride channel family protein
MSDSIRNLAVIACLAILTPIPAAMAEGSGTGGNASFPHREVDDATLERLIRLHHTETEEVRLVLLPTSVTDRRGRIVRGLDAKDFRLYEDQVSREIKYFSSEALEDISIAFMLDVSGSMRQLDKMTHAKEAIRYLVDNLRPRDSCSLICFADEQVAWVTEFTQDREWFLARLDVQEGYGQTALYDAVAAAPALVDDKIKGRKAIILITDGVDNFSRLGSAQAIELARRVNVPIYTIGFLSVPERMLPQDSGAAGLGNLRRFSAETGGRLFAVHDPDELKEAMTYLDNELRFQYLIGYYTKESGSDDAFHRIQLDVGRSRLEVHTRSGYYE